MSDKQKPRLLDAGNEALVTGIAHFYNRRRPDGDSLQSTIKIMKTVKIE
ncbi:MAG: hypothetical protein ABIU20_09500 [Blastocatellia bacterium]